MLFKRTGSSQLKVKMSDETYIPMWLLAELTYACPVQCPYCSNPLQISASRKQELSTEEWFEVLRQARKLGAVQLGFSGGEPMLRKDLVELLREAPVSYTHLRAHETSIDRVCRLLLETVCPTKSLIGSFVGTLE